MTCIFLSKFSFLHNMIFNVKCCIFLILDARILNFARIWDTSISFPNFSLRFILVQLVTLSHRSHFGISYKKVLAFNLKSLHYTFYALYIVFWQRYYNSFSRLILQHTTSVQRYKLVRYLTIKVMLQFCIQFVNIFHLSPYLKIRNFSCVRFDRLVIYSNEIVAVSLFLHDKTLSDIQNEFKNEETRAIARTDFSEFHQLSHPSADILPIVER